MYLRAGKFSVVGQARGPALVLRLGQADRRRRVRRLAHHVQRVGAAQKTRSFDRSVETGVAAVSGNDRVGEAGDVVERKVDGRIAGIHQ